MSANSCVICVGTGDAFGSGGRLNSCYAVQTSQELLLLDCGCSVLIGLQRCQLDPAAIDTVVISHLHGDHFGGLPFLLLEGKFVSQRQRPLSLIGPAGLQEQVEKALEALYPGTIDELPFPVHYRQLDTVQPLQQGNFLISSCLVKHGSSSEVYAIRLEIADKNLCYTGDTEWTDALISLTKGTDLTIAECFAYSQPVPSHLDYQTLQKKRGLLHSRRLMLTHLGPEMLEKKGLLGLDILNDGDRIEL